MSPRHFPVIALSLAFSLTGATAQQPGPSRIERWDRNGDGKLSREEVPEPLRKNFDRVDKDGYGFVSKEEDAAIGQGPGGVPGPREGVKKLADLDYAGTGNPRQTLDLYLPEKRVGSELLPLIVFIHGGAWQGGDKNGGGAKVGAYVASGKYAGASIGYRLSGEAQWPSQIHDCKAAIRWLKAHAGKYGLDPDRIAVWGSSAGGHLVAMLGVSDGIEELEGKIGPHLDQNAKVHCVIDFFGSSELLTMGDHESIIDHNAPDSPESKLVGGPILENPDKAKSASPIEHITADDAPHLIVHGDKDRVVPYPQSTDYKKRLESAAVPAILVTVAGGEHGKGFGPSVEKVVAAYLEKMLLGEKREITDKTIPAGE